MTVIFFWQFFLFSGGEAKIGGYRIIDENIMS